MSIRANVSYGKLRKYFRDPRRQGVRPSQAMKFVMVLLRHYQIETLVTFEFFQMYQNITYFLFYYHSLLYYYLEVK